MLVLAGAGWRLVLRLRTVREVVACQAEVLITRHAVLLGSLAAEFALHVLGIALKVVDFDPGFDDVGQDYEVGMRAQIVHLKRSLGISVSGIFKVDGVEALLHAQLAQLHATFQLRAVRLADRYLEHAEGELGVLAYGVRILDHGAERELFRVGRADVQPALHPQQLLILFDVLLGHHLHGLYLSAPEKLFAQVLVNRIDLVNAHSRELAIDEPQVHLEAVL